MRTYTVSFFGHRQICNSLEVESYLEQFIWNLLQKKQYIEFLVGRDGEFDQIVSSTIKRCKRTFRDDNSSLVWVMPYLTADYRDNEEAYRAYYNEIEISSEAMSGHYKSAYQTRNRAMADRSDFVVFYVEHERGGAWQTLKYVKKQNIQFINLKDMTGERI